MIIDRHDNFFPENGSKINKGILNRTYIIWIKRIKVSFKGSLKISDFNFMRFSFIDNTTWQIFEENFYCIFERNELNIEFERRSKSDIFKRTIKYFSWKRKSPRVSWIAREKISNGNGKHGIRFHCFLWCQRDLLVRVEQEWFLLHFLVMQLWEQQKDHWWP